MFDAVEVCGLLVERMILSAPAWRQALSRLLAHAVWTYCHEKQLLQR